MTYIAEILVTVALNEEFYDQKSTRKKKPTLQTHFLYCIEFYINQKLLFYFQPKKKYVYVGQINTTGESKNYKLHNGPKNLKKSRPKNS